MLKSGFSFGRIRQRERISTLIKYTLIWDWSHGLVEQTDPTWPIGWFKSRTLQLEKTHLLLVCICPKSQQVREMEEKVLWHDHGPLDGAFYFSLSVSLSLSGVCTPSGGEIFILIWWYIWSLYQLSLNFLLRRINSVLVYHIKKADVGETPDDLMVTLLDCSSRTDPVARNSCPAHILVCRKFWK